VKDNVNIFKYGINIVEYGTNTVKDGKCTVNDGMDTVNDGRRPETQTSEVSKTSEVLGSCAGEGVCSFGCCGRIICAWDATTQVASYTI